MFWTSYKGYLYTVSFEGPYHLRLRVSYGIQMVSLERQEGPICKAEVSLNNVTKGDVTLLFMRQPSTKRQSKLNFDRPHYSLNKGPESMP